MSDEQKQEVMQTATGQAIGVGFGNACAWLLLEFLTWKYQYKPADPVTTVVMAGTVFSVLTLQFGKIAKAVIGAAKYVFDRVFPPKR